MTRPPPNELHGIEKCHESSESDPVVVRFLDVLAADIDRNPERLLALDVYLLERINALVGLLEVDLTAPLSADNE